MEDLLCPKVKLQVPTLRYRFGRDDKVESGSPPWQWRRWMDRVSRVHPSNAPNL